VFPLNLYARVRFLFVHLAHETAGAASTRHSLLPLISRDDVMQTSGKECREKENVRLPPPMQLSSPGQAGDDHQEACRIASHAMHSSPRRAFSSPRL